MLAVQDIVVLRSFTSLSEIVNRPLSHVLAQSSTSLWLADEVIYCTFLKLAVWVPEEQALTIICLTTVELVYLRLG